MTEKQILAIWAPRDSVWSRWVKPGLFSFLASVPENPTPRLARQWSLPNNRRTALIVEADGPGGVELAISFAGSGYRPIPVYTACPFALSPEEAPPVVDMTNLMIALRNNADELRAIELPSDAPPAFILDRNRAGDGADVTRGHFDNRSVVMTGDFPSGKLLLQNGIEEVVVIQFGDLPAPDTRYILLGWQDAGLRIAFQSPWVAWAPRPATLKPPTWLGRVLDWLGERLGTAGTRNGIFGRIHRTGG